MARTKKRTAKRTPRRVAKARKKVAARRKPAPKRTPAQRARPRRAAPARRKKTPKKRKMAAARRRAPGIAPAALPERSWRHDLGPESGGQSGDNQGLPTSEIVDAESVEELAEEGQAFEAELVDAVENAPEGELRTREVPEDDVPEEYLDEED